MRTNHAPALCDKNQQGGSSSAIAATAAANMEVHVAASGSHLLILEGFCVDLSVASLEAFHLLHGGASSGLEIVRVNRPREFHQTPGLSESACGSFASDSHSLVSQLHQLKLASRSILVDDLQRFQHIGTRPQEDGCVGLLQDLLTHLSLLNAAHHGFSEDKTTAGLHIPGPGSVLLLLNRNGEGQVLSLGQVQDILRVGTVQPFLERVAASHQIETLATRAQLLSSESKEMHQILHRGLSPSIEDLLGCPRLSTENPISRAGGGGGAFDGLAGRGGHPMQGDVAEGEVHGVAGEER
mmetsp:Transcript_83693/g.175066  ORF Transcript_83693/g.175066 Transcript_83693/m.175066 type:complete len:297 (+) Transcript_83693:169-1059(+)